MEIRREIRKAVVAGQFYPASQEALLQEIERLFSITRKEEKRKSEERKRVIGAIVPHAGYVYSGLCAAYAYREIEKDFPKRFIILAPNHAGIASGEFSISLKDFETPLGIVENDKKMSKKLLREMGIEKDEAAHVYEHSIEVQLPFLQYIAKKQKKKFKIIPIVVSTLDFEKCIKFAKVISKKANECCIIASSDMTHYGSYYGFTPFLPQEAKEKLKMLDKKIIEEILNLNIERFYDKAKKTTICGIAPIIIVMQFAKLKKLKGYLLKYYTSADIIHDYRNAVGYASIVFSEN